VDWVEEFEHGGVEVGGVRLVLVVSVVSQDGPATELDVQGLDLERRGRRKASGLDLEGVS